MQRFKRYWIYFLPFFSLAMLITMLNLTSPLEVGPAGTLLIFVLMYLFFASMLYTITLSLTLFSLHLIGLKRDVKKQKLYYLTSITALGPVFLLALNSIGQLDLKDFVLVFLLISIACFYVTRRF